VLRRVEHTRLRAALSARDFLFDEEGGGYAQDALLLERLLTDRLPHCRRNGPRRRLELDRTCSRN